MAAAKGYIDGVNAAGGVQGRRLDLVTLNDDGDPRKHERNVRELITQRGAVALLNCQGEASCRSSAAVTAVLKVPLVGPLSGASALARSSAPWLFQVRASSAREAEALARQFRAIACFRVAIVTDAPYGVAHGSTTDVRGTSGRRDRSPAGLLGEAIPVWASQLMHGGAMGIAWNTFGLTREDLAAKLTDAGLVVQAGGAWESFAHRVDSSIRRDLIVAVNP